MKIAVGLWVSDLVPSPKDIGIDGLVVDINEFMRGFILTTKGDLQSKIDYTFRIYDENGDNQISGDEIQKMANVSESSSLQTSTSSACCRSS